MTAPGGLSRIRRHRRLALLALLACASTTAGCALLTKQDPLEPRYFSPTLSDGALERSGEAREGARAPQGLALRLGRVSSAASLKERIMHRDSLHEVGFYEERRWTERPEVFLRRALSRSLFEEHGLSRIVSGAGQTLEVELSELEEVRGSSPVARLRITYALHDEHLVRRARTLVIERPLAPSADGEAIAAALGEALREAVGRVSADVIADLHVTAAPLPTCSPPLPAGR